MLLHNMHLSYAVWSGTLFNVAKTAEGDNGNDTWQKMAERGSKNLTPMQCLETICHSSGECQICDLLR